MKYLFTTLSIGENYLTNSINFFENLSSRCSGDFNITTNTPKESKGRINYDFVNLDKTEDNRGYCPFYFNAKVLSLKYSLQKDYDFIIYVDSDWNIHKNFQEQKILNMFEFMDQNEYDFLFERPGKIGDHKKNHKSSLCRNKIEDFNVLDHDLWDNAHVVNEQFLVFKNNWKFRFFVQRWEQFLWYTIHNNIWNYAEGFEIGVSALESKMNYNWDAFRHLIPECFEFNDRIGNYHERF